MVGRTCLFTLARSSVRAFISWPKGRRYPSRLRLIRGAERRALKISGRYNDGRTRQFHGYTETEAEEALSEIAGFLLLEQPAATQRRYLWQASRRVRAAISSSGACPTLAGQAPDAPAWPLPQSAHSLLQTVLIVARVGDRPCRRMFCKACLYEGRLRAQELEHFEREEHGSVPVQRIPNRF